MTDIIMNLEMPFDHKAVETSQRKSLIYQMITIVKESHDKGIIRGDIKQANFLRREGVRLACDFSDATWAKVLTLGSTTTNCISPHRTRNRPADPEPHAGIEDGLSLSACQDYVGAIYKESPLKGYEDYILCLISERECCPGPNSLERGESHLPIAAI